MIPNEADWAKKHYAAAQWDMRMSCRPVEPKPAGTPPVAETLRCCGSSPCPECGSSDLRAGWIESIRRHNITCRNCRFCVEARSEAEANGIWSMMHDLKKPAQAEAMDRLLDEIDIDTEDDPMMDRLLRQERFIVEVTEAVLLAMKDRGVSREELAKRLGIAEDRVSEFLNGWSDMNLRTLSDVLAAIGCSPSLTLKGDQTK